MVHLGICQPSHKVCFPRLSAITCSEPHHAAISGSDGSGSQATGRRGSLILATSQDLRADMDDLMGTKGGRSRWCLLLSGLKSRRTSPSGRSADINRLRSCNLDENLGTLRMLHMSYISCLRLRRYGSVPIPGLESEQLHLPWLELDLAGRT